MRKVLGALGILALILGGLFWLGLEGREEVRGLDASTIGTDGLATALETGGIKVMLAASGTSVKETDIDLRLLPLYDMDLGDDRAETVGDTTLRTLTYGQYAQKLYYTRTLVILPKWRWAAAEKGIAAPETAIPLEDYRRLFTSINLGGLVMQRDKPAFADDFGATVFALQSFAAASLPQGCSSMLGASQRVVLMDCSNEWAETYYLSDPDLLNNHGLTVGDNPAQAVALVRRLQSAPKKPVYLDRLSADFVSRDKGDERQDYERTGDDLLRFFKPPLGEIWAMLAILLALFLWRGGRRFGPVLRADEATPERSRAEAIATRARLIRLTGQDGAMVADYVKTDLTRMAEAAFGPGRAEVGKLFPLLSRRNPGAAQEFQGLAQDLMRGQPETPARLRARLDTYHQLQRTLTHGDDT